MADFGADYFEPIEQFIARETGLPEERVRRIQEMGEPWPMMQAWSEFRSKASQDADEAGSSFDNAVIVHSQLLDELEIGSSFPHLQHETMQAQVRRVADLTGEEEETIEGLQLALHDYMKMVFETVQEVARQKMGNRSNG